MTRYLVHPPFADPTQPYLSLPTLKGYVRSKGLDAKVIDLNVEAVHWLARPHRMRELALRIGERFLDLDERSRLTFERQREYRALADARAVIEDLLAADPHPIDVMQSVELFYDPTRYIQARDRLDGLMECVSAAYFPLLLGFNHAFFGASPWSFEALGAHADREEGPLSDFFREVFTGNDENVALIDLDHAEFIGISVVFPSQVPEALHLARFVKRTAPKVVVVLGGPCIHQIAIHQDASARRELLGFADAVGLFEGEETLLGIFSRLDDVHAVADPVKRLQCLRDVPNLMVPGDGDLPPTIGPRVTMDLREAPPPDYTDLDLDRYLAPSRTLLYAPTRGCYWNQCSFCYYGLSEAATANYREVSADQAASDLARLSQKYGVKNFYISCDVLSPRYAVQLAEAIANRGLDIRWSSDLKIEKYFTKPRVEVLRRGGLRSAAFGIESGSDRILSLMRKGTDRATMTSVNRLFHDAEIATQWMTFTGHPTESLDEALDTVSWINEEGERVDLFIVGEFGLEAGSDIARRPEHYGIESIAYAPGDDLRLYARFRQKGGGLGDEERKRLDQVIDQTAAPWALSRYPWAGANSTHHSFLHFIRFGPRVFRFHFQKAQVATTESPDSGIPGLRAAPSYSVEFIREREHQWAARLRAEELYTTIRERRSRPHSKKRRRKARS